MNDKIKIIIFLFCFILTGCVQEPSKSYDIETVNNNLLNHSFNLATLVDVDYTFINNTLIYIKGQPIDETIEYFNGDSQKQQRTIFYTIGDDSRCCITLSELSLEPDNKQLVSLYLTMYWPVEEAKSYEHIYSYQYQMGNILFNVTLEGEDRDKILYFIEEFADYIRDYN